MKNNFTIISDNIPWISWDWDGLIWNQDNTSMSHLVFISDLIIFTVIWRWFLSMFQYLQNSREDPSPSNSEQNVWTYTILAPPLWNLLLLLFSGCTGGLGWNFGSESGTSCCTIFLLIIFSSFGFRPSLFVFVSWNCMCCKLSANFIQMKYSSSTHAHLLMDLW